MNQRAATFEIASIAVLLLVGMSVSTLQIDSTGVMSVAALLTVFFVASHFQTLRGLASRYVSRISWSTASTSNTTES